MGPNGRVAAVVLALFMRGIYPSPLIAGIVMMVIALALIAPAQGELQTIKDEAGRTIYTIDDDGNVTMFENSPGIDITLSATRGTKEQMQPKITEVIPESIPAGSSVILRVKGKNLVGAKVKFNRPGIEISPYATKPTSLEIPVRVPPNEPPGDVKVELTTPIGSTEANVRITELQIGTGPTRRDERKTTTIPTTAPASCPEGMVGVSAESGGFCIDLEKTYTEDYRKAEKACSIQGKRLCQAMEWRHACEQATSDGLPVKNMLGNWEWTGSWEAAKAGPSDFNESSLSSILMGKTDCQSRLNVPQWKSGSYPGRCCK
jgi:hypothetical protein